MGVFGFTGCGGCQLEILNLEEHLLEVLDAVEFVDFSMVASGHSKNYSIAIVEGSITRKPEIDRLKAIRKQAEVLVALGACACLGGVQRIKNDMKLDQVKKTVYGSSASRFYTIPSRAVDEIVKVDYHLPGCPPNRGEILGLIKALLLGREFSLPTYPVCVECRMKENVCVFDLGLYCLGPVTRAGCGAICPSNGNYCFSCRGLIDDSNLDSERELLQRYGLTVKDILNAYKLMGAYNQYAKKEG